LKFAPDVYDIVSQPSNSQFQQAVKEMSYKPHEHHEREEHNQAETYIKPPFPLLLHKLQREFGYRSKSTAQNFVFVRGVRGKLGIAGTKEEALGRIRDAGIIGMGGVGFSTHVKLSEERRVPVRFD
jgi:hypothetical protein